MKSFANDATKRSMSESTIVTVSNPNPALPVEEKKDNGKKGKRKDNRTKFSVAKLDTYNLYTRLKWMLPIIQVDEISDKDLPFNQKLSREEKLFKICLQHVVESMDGYNEQAFKKDLVQRMCPLISDKRFERACRRGEWSMFMLSQQIAWCHQDTYDKIVQRGIDYVDGYECYGLPCYRFTDLFPDFKVLGFEKEDFNGDPFSSQGKETWSKNAKEDQ